MKLITAEQRRKMLANGQKSIGDEKANPYPVVKLFTPDANCTWLLAELDPQEPDIAFGLCDLGLGFPELGSVLISEIESVRGRFGLSVERDVHFKADKSLRAYADEARKSGHITA